MVSGWPDAHLFDIILPLICHTHTPLLLHEEIKMSFFFPLCTVHVWHSFVIFYSSSSSLSPSSSASLSSSRPGGGGGAGWWMVKP